MDKKRLLTILLMCVGIVGAVSAVEVINIDFNAYNDDSVYTGTAAYDDGVNLWRTYYGGWGVALGSPKTATLVNSGGTPTPSTYAEQVWIGDPGDHLYVGGTELLDDGFRKDPNRPNDPNVTFFGNQGAYGGTFDMYVYADEAGNFSIKKPDSNDLDTQGIDGIFTPGTFSLGHNYVLFENVSIGEPNQIQLIYSNKLSAVQLVSKKTPIVIQPTTVINAENYDVAYDTNNRTGEITQWGPDIGYDATLGYFVSWLQAGEYMDYDITVDTSTMGQYNISATVTTYNGPASMQIFIDGSLVGALGYSGTGDNLVHETNVRTINLFPGNHILTWKTPQLRYHNILDLKLVKIGPVVMSTCAQVKTYGFLYEGDLTEDCQVGLDDLALLLENWANCYNPEPGACD